MRVQIELCVDFGRPVRLSEIDESRRSLLVHGVYVITEGKPKGNTIDPAAEEVVYIVKAIRQTVHGRCVRHLQSVLNARSKSGKPLSGPGHSFKQYRERINFDPSVLWVTPGVMCVDIPYAISCAEEYLLHNYKLRHGRYPWCNSAGQERHTEQAEADNTRTAESAASEHRLQEAIMRRTVIPIAREKNAWGTTVGTGAASIDIVVMDYHLDREFTEDEVEEEVRRRGLPERGAIRRHLETLRDRGFVRRSDNGWRRIR